MEWSAFFTVHKDLPREGPGTVEDVRWACERAGLAPDATVCDAGAGPGADSAVLLEHLPTGKLVTLDLHDGFVAEARARFAGDARVRVAQGDMAAIGDLPEAPFDMIWCAGALYFLGLEEGVRTFREALKPCGVLAFSEPCFFTDTPDDRAREFWDDYPTRDAAGIRQAVQEAGYDLLDTRKVADEGWEAYYRPMEARIDKLRNGADDRLTPMLDLCAEEARHWRAVKDQTGYLLVVARRA